MPETRAELEAEYQKTLDGLGRWKEHAEELGRKLGKEVATDISSKLGAEEEATSLFERMTSAELMELYQTNPTKWQEVMDGVQSAGERKLAKLNR